MKKKNTLILDDEFISYCELNRIEDIDKLAKETFNRGFTLLKYGETPNGINNTKEIIKEVPIEKIIEKEIIKEVIVTDTEEINKLIDENKKLKEDLNKITSSFNKAKFMKNSDMSSLYDE